MIFKFYKIPLTTEDRFILHVEFGDKWKNFILLTKKTSFGKDCAKREKQDKNKSLEDMINEI